MSDPQDNATATQPLGPWRRRSPQALGGDDSTISAAWSWDDDDEGGEHYVAVDGDVFVMGHLHERDELAQESISLDALERFLRSAGWTVARPA